jgi:hypothetical protein
MDAVDTLRERSDWFKERWVTEEAVEADVDKKQKLEGRASNEDYIPRSLGPPQSLTSKYLTY